MIKTEKLTINGKEFVRTYSDTGMMLERDGVLYDEAYDPADAGREYIETDQLPCEQAEAVKALFERHGVIETEEVSD